MAVAKGHTTTYLQIATCVTSKHFVFSVAHGRQWLEVPKWRDAAAVLAHFVGFRIQYVELLAVLQHDNDRINLTPGSGSGYRVQLNVLDGFVKLWFFCLCGALNELRTK